MKTRSLSPAVLIAALAVLSAASVLAAADEQQISASRQQGIEYIKSRQAFNGAWNYEGHPVGITALCTLALLENGVPISDPVVNRGLRYVRDNVGDLDKTYDITLAILLFHRVGSRLDRGRVRDLAARLIAGQQTSGGWTYSCPKVSGVVLTNPGQMPKRGESPGDNSNTQFGVLGLWVASRQGIDIKGPMDRVAERFLTSQNADGGWAYRHTGPSADGAAGEPELSKNSMTFAGLFCLTVARAAKLRQLSGDDAAAGGQLKAGEGDTLMRDPAFARGLERAGQYVKAGGANRYYLWSTERLGVLLGLRDFGGVDWFEKGADALVKSQLKDGSWPDGKETPADTAFAVLFLRKANLGSDISRLLAGDPDKPFQIVTQDEQPRFATFDEAFEAAREGDSIRIDSSDTFALPHIEIDKTLALQAGAGYEPVFTYEVGKDRLGIRARPASDPNARFILRVTKGELTLEGLTIQMDPPEVGRDIPWAALKLDGGNLRMLNCTVSEGNRRGMAGVQLAASGSRAVVRNSMFVGGRAAVEALPAENQELFVENSVLFSNKGVLVAKGDSPTQQGALKVTFDHATINGPSGIEIEALLANVDVVSRGTIFKTDWISSTFLRNAQNRAGRVWSGRENLYDVKDWLGAQGRRLPEISDVKSWMVYWKGDDADAESRTVPFRGRRQKTAFSHTARPHDWDFDEDSNLVLYRDRWGASTLLVGPGDGYQRFRDSILYSQWQAGATGEVASAADGDSN